jgi:hypothetical protein
MFCSLLSNAYLVCKMYLRPCRPGNNGDTFQDSVAVSLNMVAVQIRMTTESNLVKISWTRTLTLSSELDS